MKKNTDEHALIILNGDPATDLISDDALKRYDYILAVDGALNHLSAAGIAPDAVTGDMDSVRDDILEEFRRQGGVVDHQPEQNSTDFEKAIRHCLRLKVLEADVIGYLGQRLDHQLAVWDVALRFSRRIRLRFLDSIAESRILRQGGELTFFQRREHLCSVIPLLPCSGVTLKGFRWPLENAVMRLGTRISCSNEINEDSASVSVTSGALLIVLHRKPGKKA